MKIHLGQPLSFRQIGQRGNQEDSRYPDTDRPNKEQRFFVVCDGVGGSAKGDVASSVVCKSIGEALSYINLSDMVLDDEMFSKVLDGAYDALDELTDDTNRGMATTLTFVCLHKGGCTMAHIGDSRIYHIRPGVGILYRSEDHSLVNSMVHSGLITPEEAVKHPQRNVITRCMEAVDSDQNRSSATVALTTDIKVGDYFFMCSDGVLSCISDDELLETLDLEMDDEKKMSHIANKCIDSTDNNTAILIPISEVEEEGGRHEAPFLSEDTNVTHLFEEKSHMVSEIFSTQKPQSSKITQIFKRLFCK